jgi:catalase
MAEKKNTLTTAFGIPVPDDQNSLTSGEPPFEVTGLASQKPYTLTDDDFFQPGELYRRVMTDEDREHLVGNIVDHLANAKKRIQLRQAAIFYKADPDYGRRGAGAKNRGG